MQKRWQSYCTILMPAFILFLFAVLQLVMADKSYSDTERRVLAQKPAMSEESIISGKYMSAFENYSLDQFPMRDGFRKLKAVTIRSVFGKKDDHGYYIADGYLSKLEYPLNELRVKQSIQNQRKIYENYLKGTDCQVYQCIIPDKNFYLASANGYPVMDYDAYRQMVYDGADYAKQIDVFSALKLDCYYHTDQHFRQESLEELVKILGNQMNVDFETQYDKNELDVPFYGAYKDQASLPIEADTIYYLTNEEINACQVTSLNTGIPKASYMYDMEKAHGKDPYEMFLSGSDAFLTIENPNAKAQKELVLFRDSFGSSLAPLLVHGYSKITLIDLRYVRSEVLAQLIEFDHQDILFAYSTLVF